MEQSGNGRRTNFQRFKRNPTNFQPNAPKNTENFLVLPTKNSIELGITFIKKLDITINPAKNLMQLNDLTLLINKIKTQHEQRRMIRPEKISIYRKPKIIVQPNENCFILSQLSQKSNNLEHFSGIVIPTQILEKKTKDCFNLIT